MTDIGVRLGTIGAKTASAEVWHAWVEASAGVISELSDRVLSPTEQAKRAKYRSDSAASCYVVTRSLVRCVLGERMGVPPRSVPISHTDLGKPVVAGGLHFNVSHSGDLVVLAISSERAVGIDVERSRTVERASALVARWLTISEQRDVAHRIAAGTGESDAFLQVWSLKEARLKALGVGISDGQNARVDDLEAVSLEPLLRPIGNSGTSTHYVGAVAFA